MAALVISDAWKTSSYVCPNCSAAGLMWWKSRFARSDCKRRSTGTAPLPSEKPTRRLEDIIENAQAVLRYKSGMDQAAFAGNRLVYDAVERCLERVCEAA